ncbi:hypothetical protein [Microbacterium abyssi]|uniref:hypothetical protein n=1 Tax=Microbacterium abyssi TaxID=2782166 RepID=UPI001888D481|nr:hypothetical protein [Microbacterium sp. A18JL241]
MNTESRASRGSGVFDPESVGVGAVISHSGDTLVTNGDEIIAAVEELTDRTFPADPTDGWLTDDVPVLARSDSWIVPLAWVPELPGDAAAPRRQMLRSRVGDLWTSVRSACEYRHGSQIGIGLESAADGKNRYVSELVRTGVRRADWWAFGEWAVVLVVHGEPVPAPVSQMAVHVVPIGWVSERRAAKRVPEIDLGWSWSDVVGLAGSRGTEGSLADVKEEDQGS